MKAGFGDWSHVGRLEKLFREKRIRRSSYIVQQSGWPVLRKPTIIFGNKQLKKFPNLYTTKNGYTFTRATDNGWSISYELCNSAEWVKGAMVWVSLCLEYPDLWTSFWKVVSYVNLNWVIDWFLLGDVPHDDRTPRWYGASGQCMVVNTIAKVICGLRKRGRCFLIFVLKLDD